MDVESALHHGAKYDLQWFFGLTNDQMAAIDKQLKEESARRRRLCLLACGGLLDDLYPNGIDAGPSYRGREPQAVAPQRRAGLRQPKAVAPQKAPRKRSFKTVEGLS